MRSEVEREMDFICAVADTEQSIRADERAKAERELLLRLMVPSDAMLQAWVARTLLARLKRIVAGEEVSSGRGMEDAARENFQVMLRAFAKEKGIDLEEEG